MVDAKELFDLPYLVYHMTGYLLKVKYFQNIGNRTTVGV